MTPKLRFVLCSTLAAAGLLAAGACDPGTPAPRSQEGSVAPGTEAGDLERNIGEEASLSGYEGTVTSVEWRRALTDSEDRGFLLVDVAVRNVSDEAQPYHFFDWRLQLPDGSTIDPTITSLDQLRSGDLEPGKGVEGTVVFEVPDPTGDFRVVYKPVSASSVRALWKASGTLCMPGAGTSLAVGSCGLVSE